MADILLPSGLLCFIQSSIASMPKSNIITIFCGFNSAEEILEAKNLLFNVAEKLKNNCDILCDLPRNKGRRAEGDSRRRLDSDDLLELWAVLDAAKTHLTLFAAVNSKRLSPFTLSDADLCTITVNMMEMKIQLEELRAQLPSMIKSQLASWQPSAMLPTASASAS